MQDRIDYTLKFPVILSGETTTVISLRRPKGRDMKRALNMAKSIGDMTAAMIVNLGEVSPAVVDELDAADWLALSDIVGNFMGKGDAGALNDTAQ